MTLNSEHLTLLYYMSLKKMDLNPQCFIRLLKTGNKSQNRLRLTF